MSALITDGQHFLSVDHVRLAEELQERYYNLGIAWVPPENRSTHEPYPFAIVDTYQNIVIKPLKESQVNAQFVFTWLWENDSQRVNTWDKFQKEIEKAKAERDKKNYDKIAEQAEVIHDIQKSPIHNYKINGRTLGADNEKPSLKEKD